MTMRILMFFTVGVAVGFMLAGPVMEIAKTIGIG